MRTRGRQLEEAVAFSVHVPIVRRPAVRRTGRRSPPWLTLIILTVASRTATAAYPAVGLVRDDQLTALGRIVWPGLAMVCLAALVGRRPPSIRIPATPLLAVVGVVVLSTLWSADLPRTAYQSVVLVSILICCAYITTRHTAARCLLIVATYLAVVCALNGLTAFFHLSDPLRRGGMMEHKNLLGALAATSVVTAWCASRLLSDKRRLLMVGGAAVSALVLLTCESRSGVFSLVVASAVATLAYVKQHKPGNLVAASVLFAALAGLVTYRAAGGLAGILNASGKDLTLTGRTEIWRYVLDVADRHPWHGWGYFAIWGERALDGSGTPAHVVLGIRSSHSGYIEMYAGAGRLGLAVLIGALAVLMRWSYLRSRSHGPTGSWALAICVFAIVQNASESVVPGTVQTMIFALLAIATATDRQLHTTALRRFERWGRRR